MEKIAHYQQIIKSVLNSYVSVLSSQSDEEVYLVEDPALLHYLVYHNAWRQGSRSYGCLVHIRIKNDKVYVEYDGTDEAFADVLTEAGIPRHEIVLAFHAPAKRPYTDFAVA